MSRYFVVLFYLLFAFHGDTFAEGIVLPSTLTASTQSLLAIEWETLTLPKEFILNCLSVVHWQSMMMILSSEKDFSLNTSSPLIRYPHSFRATLLQLSTEFQRVFTDLDSLMYRLQLAMKRIPDYIKIILRLEKASSLMKETMLASNFNNIVRTAHENLLMTNATIHHWNQLTRLFREVQAVSTPPGNRTGIILADEYDSKRIINQIDLLIREITRNLDSFLQYLVQLERQAKLNSSMKDDMVTLLPNLYNLERLAYFIYETAYIFNSFSHRYLLPPLAGTGRYVILQTNEDRWSSFTALTKRWSQIVQDINQSLMNYELEYESNNLLLKQVYEKMMRAN